MIFTWNGTTSGVRVPDGGWIKSSRAGLTICDATSAAFAQPLPFDKLDVVTFSWQKVLGGEAQHGMLVLSPRAVARLETYQPAWPLPKIFRMTSGGKLTEGLFAGETHQHAFAALRGGLSRRACLGQFDRRPRSAFRPRRRQRRTPWRDWVEQTDWVDFLARDPATRSNTSVCLVVVDPAVRALDPAATGGIRESALRPPRGGGRRLRHRVLSRRAAGLRIWCGGTVEQANLEALLPWLDWAFAEAKAGLRKAA